MTQIPRQTKYPPLLLTFRPKQGLLPYSNQLAMRFALKQIYDAAVKAVCCAVQRSDNGSSAYIMTERFGRPGKRQPGVSVRLST